MDRLSTVRAAAVLMVVGAGLAGCSRTPTYEAQTACSIETGEVATMLDTDRRLQSQMSGASSFEVGDGRAAADQTSATWACGTISAAVQVSEDDDSPYDFAG